MLEQQQSQLVNGLQELYRRLETSQGWPGASLQDSGNGHPLTHDILARLGVLSADGPEENESFEEDLDLVQQKLLDGGSGLTQRQDSGDSDSDHGHTPASFFDLSPTKLSLFRDPFTLAQLPPTPPTHSPYPRSGRSSHTQGSMDSLPQTQAPQANTYASMNPAILQRQMWPPAPVSYEENMDFAQQVGLPTMYQGIAGDFNRHLMAMNTMSPRVAIPDWNEEDFSAFLNPTTMV